MKIETNREKYYINTEEITYINVYTDNIGLLTLDIRFKNNDNIVIDEQETGITKIKEIIDKIEMRII